ncbi:pyridoxal kinase PdxY [Novispirillum sp. DQ9]|uniref:pyridoxal kinase PdxY n=1 Tax=Novispirillum sp. DQ9 TaxID=3398612 RepID=UPI003C7D43D7
MRTPAVLSVQSHVAFGHVGNAAAVFPLQRLGFEVWPVHTCQLSNHTGYPTVRGRAFDAAHVAEVLAGLDERGVLATCGGVLSGWLGGAAVGEAIAAAVGQVRGHRPDALYLCDPVMGDDTLCGERLYCAADIPAFVLERLVPLADVLTPNRFELATLAGAPVRSLGDAVAAARGLMARGPRLVVVTSLPGEAEGTIACLAVTKQGAWRVATPRIVLDTPVNGAGDMLAALLLGHLLHGAVPPEALALAVSAVHAVIDRTRLNGVRELEIIAGQEAFAATAPTFPAEPCGLPVLLPEGG